MRQMKLKDLEYKYLYVMDYSDCSINEISLTVEDNKNLDCPEFILGKYGFNDGNCSWMFSNKQCSIDKAEDADLNKER